MNLSSLRPGEATFLESYDFHNALIARLVDMGLNPQTPISCLFESLSKDLFAYKIGESVIAIRREDADLIKVSK